MQFDDRLPTKVEATTDLRAIAYATFAYHALVILVGFVFTFLGYRLFRVGIYEKAGELKTSWKGANLVLRQAAPGTFFVLFGTLIICVALFRGPNIQDKTQVPSTSPC